MDTIKVRECLGLETDAAHNMHSLESDEWLGLQMSDKVCANKSAGWRTGVRVQKDIKKL